MAESTHRVQTFIKAEKLSINRDVRPWLWLGQNFCSLGLGIGLEAQVLGLDLTASGLGLAVQGLGLGFGLSCGFVNITDLNKNLS